MGVFGIQIGMDRVDSPVNIQEDIKASSDKTVSNVLFLKRHFMKLGVILTSAFVPVVVMASKTNLLSNGLLGFGIGAILGGLIPDLLLMGATWRTLKNPKIAVLWLVRLLEHAIRIAICVALAIAPGNIIGVAMAGVLAVLALINGIFRKGNRVINRLPINEQNKQTFNHRSLNQALEEHLKGCSWLHAACDGDQTEVISRLLEDVSL